MTRSLSKKIKVSIIETLPYDLVCDILRRVAASSLMDITNVKLSCKKLKEIAEDTHIYQHVSLERIPIIQMKPINQNQHMFLNKCMESGNPDMMYRLALVDFVTKANLVSAYQNLDRAVKLGHLGALYFTCIVLLLSGNEEYKQKGIKMLGNMKRSTSLNRKLKLCRNNLLNEIRGMWKTNPCLQERPVCCTTRHVHPRKNPWDEEEDDGCEACGADIELKLICGR